MRSITTVLILLFVLAACQQKPASKNHAEQKTFDLLTLPSDWVRLTKTDSGMIIFNSCDMGNLLLTITKNNQHTSILLHGTQEDYEFDVLKSTLIENDTALINARWKGSNVQQDFKFVWENKDKSVGRWITKYPEGFISDLVFVTAGRKSDYKTINQPCRECWGDECDEMENNNKAQSDSSNEHIVKMLKDFYTGYITTIAAGPSPDFESTIDALRKKYCTKKLVDKIAKDFDEGLDYDLFVNAQDSDIEYLKTLSVNKDSQKDNLYTVSYVAPNNETITIKLMVIKEKDDFKIDEVL